LGKDLKALKLRTREKKKEEKGSTRHGPRENLSPPSRRGEKKKIGSQGDLMYSKKGGYKEDSQNS